MQLLINKKYTLPYMALDELVKHFDGFKDVRGPLPIIWHQSLLALAQRYKNDLRTEQKDALRDLMHIHTHYSITPEIRREMFTAASRGEAASTVPTAGLSKAHLVKKLAPVPAPRGKAPSASMDIEY